MQKLEGWLDQESSIQQGEDTSVVRVNLLTYLSDKNESLPSDLDKVVIANVGDHQVEAFLLLHAERERLEPIRPTD